MEREELGAANSRLEEVAERVKAMADAREARMTVEPTQVTFPPGMSEEQKQKALAIMAKATPAGAALKRQLADATTLMPNIGQFSITQTPYRPDSLVDVIKQHGSGVKANDRQVGGNHYKDATIEPWDVIDTWPKQQQIGAYRAGALKYVMRAGDKDDFKQEIGKAHHYLEKLLEILE